MTSSPKFKNLGLKLKHSPIELKEKMRKNYKMKVQNCRGMLMDKLRGSVTETDLHDTLTVIYKSMFNTPKETIDEDEYEIMDELKNELVQEELEWWIKEYEQCHMLNVDWSSMEENNDVICPICQKTNLLLNNGNLRCMNCSITVPTQKSLAEIKASILSAIESHHSVCSSDTQFSLITEVNDTHLYLICDTCMDMKLVI